MVKSVILLHSKTLQMAGNHSVLHAKFASKFLNHAYGRRESPNGAAEYQISYSWFRQPEPTNLDGSEKYRQSQSNQLHLWHALQNKLPVLGS